MEEITGEHEVLAGLAAAGDAVRSGLAAMDRSYGLSDAQVRDGLAAALRLVAAAQSLALRLTKELDERPDVVPDAAGAGGAKTFLVEALHLDGGKAKGFVDCAHTLDPDSGDLRAVGRALADGGIGLEQASICVRAVARLPKRLKAVTVTDEQTGEQVSGIEAVDRMLARTIADIPPRGVGWLTDRLVTLLDPGREERFDADADQRRGLSLTVDSTGMGVLRAYLTPVDTAWLKAVLSQLARPAPQSVCTVENPDGSVQEEAVRDGRSLEARQYDAWMTLIRRGLVRATGPTVGQEVSGSGGSGRSCIDGIDRREAVDGNAARAEVVSRVVGAAGPAPQTGRAEHTAVGGLPEVRLVITATAEQAAGLRGAGKATLDRVGPIDARVLSVFTCSATLRRVLTDPRGVPIDVGRAYRLATPALRAALVARDRGCIVPGCTVPADACDAHHVIAWSVSGRTDLANMVLVCARHHAALHDGVYEVEVRDGIPHVRPPAWVDPLRRWRRNPLHHNASHVTRTIEQLVLALSDLDDSGDLGDLGTGAGSGIDTGAETGTLGTGAGAGTGNLGARTGTSTGTDRAA